MKTEIPKTIKVICNLVCRAFFVLIAVGLTFASIGLNNPIYFLLAIGVAVIYIFAIAKIISGACLLFVSPIRFFTALADYSIVAALFLLLATILFPPWQYTADRNGEDGYHSRKPAGYALIFNPPKPQSDYSAFGVKIDFGRLSLEWAALAAVTGIVWVLTVKPAWGRGDKVNHSQKADPPTSRE